MDDRNMEQTTTNEKLGDEESGFDRSLQSSKGEDSSSASSIENTETQKEQAALSKAQIVPLSAALAIAVFCVALDNTIISTAIPKITDRFEELSDVGWYGSAYLLTNCTFQLVFGKLYSVFHIKWTFMFALAIFEIGSVVCAAAPTSDALIIGRALAGVGAGGLFSGTLIIIAHTVPMADRPVYIGGISSMFGIASIVGPLLGGAFTDLVTWRLCFYINLPLGLMTAIGVMSCLRKAEGLNKADRTKNIFARLNSVDPVGIVLFIGSVICLLLALQWGGTFMEWSDARIIALFVVSGIAFLVFLAEQWWMGEGALVPAEILVYCRTVPFSLIWAFFIGASFFTFVYFLPMWFQVIKNTSAVGSGIHTLAFLLSQVVATIFSGVAVKKFGYYVPLMWLSAIFSSVGSGLMTTFGAETPSREWIGYQIIFGLGIGFGMQQAVVAVQTVLPKKHVAIGSSLVMFFQLLGGSIFVSVAQSVFTNKLFMEITKINPELPVESIIGEGATQLRKMVDIVDLPDLLIAYNDALILSFRIGLAMACLLVVGVIGMEWRTVKG
ncbi:hypothetical protein FQN57_004557 [Myotisia sp. PD_48]|nr:hypothetical protein FQN57_004557 [Myotisia sp. PD_48]